MTPWPMLAGAATSPRCKVGAGFRRRPSAANMDRM